MSETGQPIEHQGTLSSAVDVMPDIEQLEREDNGNAVPRDDLGRFQRTQEEAGQEAPEQAEGDDNEERKEPEQLSGEDAVEASDEDGEWIEIEGDEEGQEPVRLKLDEVYEGYQRAQQLEAELENVKTSTPPPPDYDQAIIEAIDRGQQYLDGLRQVEAMLHPVMPDDSLINPQSPTYDPDAYFAQKQWAESQAQQLNYIQQQREAAEREVNERSEAVARARFAREQQKLMSMWPELQQEANAHKVREDASRFYGIDNETLNSVHDSRFYAVLKDALAYRQQQGASQKAVKAVKAKPKLVKGKAKATESKARRTSQRGMQRLMETGRPEDAIDALEGLIK